MLIIEVTHIIKSVLSLIIMSALVNYAILRVQVAMVDILITTKNNAYYISLALQIPSKIVVTTQYVRVISNRNLVIQLKQIAKPMTMG